MKAKTTYIFIFCIVAFFTAASWVWIYDPFCLTCAKPASPQASAMGTIRTLGIVEAEFQYKRGRYGTWQEISEESSIGSALASRIKYHYDYRFEIRLGEKEFEAVATPVKVVTGATCSFYLSSSDWKIRGADKQGKEADVNDPVLE
jgi:hypothetical protein